MLSLRLSSLAKFVDISDNLIDIGCDHALLDIYLVNSKRVKSLIASDNKVRALNQGIKNVKNEHLEDKIDLRLGNGLEVLKEKDKVNTILISGMGTTTILEILNHTFLKNINKLIIQSNNDHASLREHIVSLGYYIKEEEYLVDNNKNYISIVFLKGDKKYTKNELRYGPILIKNANYLRFEIKNITKILNYIPKNKLFLRLKLKRELNLLNKLLKKAY